MSCHNGTLIQCRIPPTNLIKPLASFRAENVRMITCSKSKIECDSKEIRNSVKAWTMHFANLAPEVEITMLNSVKWHKKIFAAIFKH